MNKISKNIQQTIKMNLQQMKLKNTAELSSELKNHLRFKQYKIQHHSRKIYRVTLNKVLPSITFIN